MAGVLKKSLMITTIDPKWEPILTVLINSRPDQDISISDIALEASYSPRTVKRHLKDMKSSNIIEVKKRGTARGNKSQYGVNPVVFTLIKRKQAV
jgi:AraC-like DNA-binding protein